MLKLHYLRALHNVILKPLTMQQFPIHIQLEPTTYCNLNCKACTRLTYLERFQHLSLDHFRLIVEQIRPAKISCSGGGEPFMHPHLFEMIQMAKAVGCSMNTTTNGTLLTPDGCSQLVSSGLDLLKVSVDGASRETYQKSRREDRFQQVIEGIQTLNAAKKQYGSATPYIRFNYVMLKDNYREMAETVQLAAELGVHAVYFQPLDLIGIEAHYEELVGELQYEELAREIRRGIQMSQRYPVQTNLRLLHHNLPLYWKKYRLETRQSDRRKCILPWFSTYITVDGNMHPCCSCSQPNTIMGNLFEMPFEQIWNGTRYQEFRRAIRAGQRPYKICTNCVPDTLSDILKLSRILPGFFR